MNTPSEPWELIACTLKGHEIFRKRTIVGGYVYASDGVGGGVVVCDLSTIRPSTLEAIAALERSAHL